MSLQDNLYSEDIKHDITIFARYKTHKRYGKRLLDIGEVKRTITTISVDDNGRERSGFGAIPMPTQQRRMHALLHVGFVAIFPDNETRVQTLSFRNFYFGINGDGA